MPHQAKHRTLNIGQRGRRRKMSAKLMDEDQSSLAAAYLPSVEEANAIRSRNMKRGELIRGINKEIATLCAQRRRLIAASIIGKAIIAPIRKIPVEVLEEILFQCIPSFVPQDFRTEHDPHPQDVCRLLGNVCKKWNIIVNDTPRLWSSLTFTWEILVPKYVDKLLNKSKSHPLDIFIEPHIWISRENVEIPKVFTMLHREFWRIRKLIAFTDEVALLPPGFPLHAPLMQSFTHTPRKETVPGDDFDLGGAYCPKLHSLTLINSDNIVRTLAATPMHTMRHLRVDSTGPNALYLQLLNSLPHLVSLYWGDSFSAGQPLEAPLAISLQSLKSLQVKTAESAVQLLSRLYAPSLESLEIICYRAYRGFVPLPMEEIIEIICRDGVVKLRRLHLYFGTFGTLVPMMLRKLDHLDTLIIGKMLEPGHLLTALAVPDQDFGILCPKLATLVISDTEVPWAPFDNFVHRRMLADSEEPAPGFITSLKLHDTRTLLDDDHFQHCLQTHSATIHITFGVADPSLEYFPPMNSWS